MIQMYSTDKPLKVCELFAGIGSQIQALKNIGIPCESVISEIDKFAIKSYEAIHGPTENVGDISKVAELPKSDLWTYSFPCQDLSIAGDMKGMEEGSGTRSSLLWEVGRLLKVAKTNGTLPKILLMENVPAILNKNNIGSFQKWMDELTELGYTSSYAVLNAKDFGIPQNRKRCFMVSTLNGKKFRFPTGVPLDKCLRDMLESEVEPEYYVSEDRMKNYQRDKNISVSDVRITGRLSSSQDAIVVDPAGVSPCHTAGHGNCPKIEVVGHLNNYAYESIGRVYGKNGLAPTVPTAAGGGHIPRIEENVRVRYLNPLECWRLMGFPDEAFDKAKAAGISKTQLYKQAGNSIVVNVLEAIFRGIYIEETWE